MNKQFDKVRRSDRQETGIDFLREVLENTISCAVAVETGSFPLIHSTFFVYDKVANDLIFHFSKYGFGGEQIASGKNISISIYKTGKLYTAPKAVDFGGEYQSVIVYGKIKILEEEDEIKYAMKIFFNKFFGHIPASEYSDFTTTETRPIFVVRVNIEKWFGKQHRTPDVALKSFYSEIPAVL